MSEQGYDKKKQAKRSIDNLPPNDFGYVCPECGYSLQQSNKHGDYGEPVFLCKRAIGEQSFDLATRSRFMPPGAKHSRVRYWRREQLESPGGVRG